MLNEKTKMELLEILKEAKTMADHNLSCYSANWTMMTAKEGFEKQHAEAKEKYNKVCRLLEAFI